MGHTQGVMGMEVGTSLDPGVEEVFLEKTVLFQRGVKGAATGKDFIRLRQCIHGICRRWQRVYHTSDLASFCGCASEEATVFVLVS
jgi:hypothetical protein